MDKEDFRKMNILILSWRDISHPLAGGAENVTNEHAKAWVKAGHKVTLFTSYYKGAKEYQDMDGIQTIRKGYELLGVQLRCFLWYLFSKHDKFDLVVDHFHGIPFFSPIYIRTRKIAVIQEVAKKVWLLNHLKRPLNWFIGTLGYVIEPLTFIPYRKIPFVTGSESVKMDLIGFGIPDKNITVIEHGVSIIYPEPFPAKEKNKTIMYLGALTRDKGIQDALRVFAILNKKNPDYRFWVAGKGMGAYFDFLMATAFKLGLRDKITFWGYVSEAKKFDLLARSHVLIHPSATEGWGLNVIESSAMGTPVIGYDVSGLRDSIKENINGYLVPAGNTELMAVKIEQLLSDKVLLNKIGITAKSYAASFSWLKSKALFIAYLNEQVRRRILILNWKDIKHPDAGGAEIVTLEYAKSLVIAGYDVTWFSSSFKDAARSEVVAGVKIVRRGMQVFGVQIAAPFFYYSTRPYDLVIDQFHGIPFFTPLFVYTKKLGFIHEVAKEVWKLNPWPLPFNLIPATIGLLFEPLIFKLFYRGIPFLTVSESTKKDLISWGVKSDLITVIYNGLPIRNRFLIDKKEKVHNITYLGVLTKDKGIEDALRVFSKINNSREKDKYNYWVIGKGSEDYLSKLKKMSLELGISKKLKFWGYVDDDLKYKLLSKSFVLVNPSVREGWGLVNLEANAVGTPVIAYNVAGTRDSVLDKKTGLLSKIGDYGNLADNVLLLAGNTEIYQKYRKNAILWSKKFTWEKAQKQNLNLIEKIIN